MQLKLTSSRYGALDVSTQIPERNAHMIIQGAEPTFGIWYSNSLLLQKRTHGDFSIYHATIAGKQADQLHVSYMKGTVILHLALSGTTRYTLQGLSQLTLHERSFNIYYTPAWMAKISVQQSTTTGIFLCMPAEVFQPHSFRHPVAKVMLRAIRNDDPMKLSDFNHVADYNLLMMLKLGLAGDTSADWLAAAANYGIELALSARAMQRGRIDATSVDTLYQVRQIITQDLKTQHSLHDLSLLTGLTQYQLKTWFPMIFGISINDYRIEAKIIKAISLLPTKEKLAVIAAEVGYSESQLRRAFLEYFGVPPQDYTHGMRKKV